MHRARHPMDISLVVDDENDEEGSSEHLIPSSTTSDYSSLIVNSPPDTMYHRIRSPSPSPTSSVSLNHHSMQGAQSTHASTSVRHIHRRLSLSSSQVDFNGSASNIHRDRLRFNTWPRHRKEKRDILVEHDKRLAKSIIQELGIGINKTYRNPWGNLSYAQLITRAIDSSPWKRLTLNEVYEWIIKFVPYFKDKIDAKTSWGWKNSIRHNLSLHNQFIRVPVISSLSKGPVKYVWTINPSFKNNSPYKKYSLKRKRAAAAAALASQAAAAAAAAATSNVNSNSSPLASSQEHHSPTSTPSQPLVNMSNNYHRQASTNSTPPAPIAKATRLGEHSQGNGSSTLNQLSVAAAMMSAGITDPAAYRAFLNSQASAMMTKQKQQQTSTTPFSSSTSSITHRPTQSSSGSYAHETGLPVPKKVALGADRYKQQQHQEWHLSSYRQGAPAPPPPPYNGRPPHPSGSSKMHLIQQRGSYLPPPPPASSSSRLNSDMNNLSPSLQRRGSSPPSYPSAAAIAAATAQNKLLAQTKLWHAAVQAAAAHAHQQQQQYHHQPPPPPPPSSSNAINELQNYINRSNTSNGNHNKLPGYLNPETLKLLSSTGGNNHPIDEQQMYSNDPRYKLMRASYPNATSGSIPTACLIRQRINPSNSAALTQQQQIDMVTAAYHNYRRRSSGFSSTTSHGGPSDDENDEYAPPRKDSSTSNASSGYESSLAVNRQSPPTSSSVRTGSGSSIASEASSSSYYYHPHHNNNNNNAAHSSSQPSRKMPSNSNEVDMDDPQQLSIHAVGGYVDDLMERIRKMPPKKRSKFYQMLDEERLKDVNNNNHDGQTKSKHDEAGDNSDHNHHVSMEVTRPLVVTEVASDEDDDRTLIEHAPKAQSMPMNDNERDEKFQHTSQAFSVLNDKTFEELLSLGVPVAVLKAIAFQQHQQSQTSSKKTNTQLSNFLTKKCLPTSDKSAAEKSNFLNARTILRKILQQQQKHSISAKSLVEAMDYTSDEEEDLLPDERDDDEDDDEQQSSSSMAPRHRNGIRSNSYNPVTVTLNSNDIASLSPPTSTSSSPDETDVNHQSSPNSISRPSSTPAALISSGCSY